MVWQRIQKIKRTGLQDRGYTVEDKRFGIVM